MINKRGQVGIIIIAAVVIIAAILFFSLRGNFSSDQEGRVVFTITDAAADMGSVSSVELTVDKIEAHTEAEGWVTISSTPRTYNLLELKAQNKEVVLADTELKEGTYTQVRLQISNVMITDEEGENEAKLPSGELRIVGNFIVEPNSTSSVKFDFIADESVHVTGNGEYVFAPVVQYETRSNTDVSLNSDNSAEVNGGNIVSNTKVGMDVNGNVGVGLNIPSNAALNIGSNGRVSLGSAAGLGLS